MNTVASDVSARSANPAASGDTLPVGAVPRPAASSRPARAPAAP